AVAGSEGRLVDESGTGRWPEERRHRGLPAEVVLDERDGVAQGVTGAALVAARAGGLGARAGSVGGGRAGGRASLIPEGGISRQAGVVGPARGRHEDAAEQQDQRERPHARGRTVAVGIRPRTACPAVECRTRGVARTAQQANRLRGRGRRAWYRARRAAARSIAPPAARPARGTPGSG